MDKLPITFLHQLLPLVTITERERFRRVSRQWNTLALSYRPTLQVSYIRVHEGIFMINVDMYSVQGGRLFGSVLSLAYTPLTGLGFTSYKKTEEVDNRAGCTFDEIHRRVIVCNTSTLHRL